MSIKKLHYVILPNHDHSKGGDFVEKNVIAFVQLIQRLDDKSLSLVIQDAKGI